MKLIAGKFNRTNEVCYWNYNPIEETTFEIGDYAIVENANDFDLVKIIGIIETEGKYAHFYTNGRALKNVVKIVDRYLLRED